MTPLYLIANYTCQEAQFSIQQCEDIDVVTLSCPGTNRIIIQNALFGRQDWNITCSHPTAIHTANCSSSTALSIVQAACDGRSVCHIYPNSVVFGDPCPGTYKYLQVQYSCGECENALGDDTWCLYAANEGYCLQNASYMMTYCRKACTRCGDTPELECKNYPPESDASCAQKANASQCVTNPNYMYVYCRKACLQCNTNTQCINNYVGNDQANCTVWKSDQQCAENPSWMLANCRASCFSCNDTIKCENQYPTAQCEQWALQGNCSSQPGFMIANCAKTCLGCGHTDPPCVNLADDATCDNNYVAGLCSGPNAVWMYRNCWKSCVQCQGTPACANADGQDAVCDALALGGECDSSNINRCFRSCTRCKPSPAADDCVNIAPDTNCTQWQSEGLCITDVSFMYSNCRRACTGCYALPTFVGGPSLPGDNIMTSNLTASGVVLIPEQVQTNGALSYFFAFFAVKDVTVNLQIWRPQTSSTNGTLFDLVYQLEVAAPSNSMALTAHLPDCFIVQPGDRIGFTSFDGPSPVGATYSASQLQYATFVRQAAASYASLAFDRVNIPYRFSVGVALNLQKSTC